MAIQCNKISETIKKKCTAIMKAVDNINACIDRKEFGLISSYDGQLAAASKGLPDAINRLISSTGNDPLQINDLYAPEKCEVTINDNIVRIKFGSLLPHKEKRGAQSYVSSIPFIRVFYKESEKLPNIQYNEPVVVAFIHHYSAKEEMVDHDNLLYKPFIDAISVIFLKNDSPRQCAHFMDYMMDRETFSEVYIVPQNIFIQFYKTISLNKE